VCGFNGVFVGSRDSVKAHLNGQEHAKAVAKQAAAGSSKSQPTLAAAFATAAAKGTAKYPSNYTPKPADIPSGVLAAYVQKKRCLGWFAETLVIGGVQHSVRPLLLDLLPGELWYADPHFHRSSAMPEFASQRGTFWHKECLGFDCTNCPKIPSLPEFKKRLMREEQSETKRGQRVAEHGVRLEYLQREELMQSVRAWQSRWKTLQYQNYWLNLHVLNLSRSKEDLSSKLKRALMSGSLPEVAEFFKRASDAGAFDGRSTLLNFLLDLGKNLISVQEHDGIGTGKRHSRSSKMMYECLLQFGGPLVSNFLRLNLLGPAINTSKSLYRRDALLYVGLLQESTFERVACLLKQIMASKGITGPVPFEVSEDETACIALATWNRRTDCIDGFCGPKATPEVPHLCSFDCNPSAGTYETIKAAFDGLVVGTMCSVVALNPLCVGLPTLVLAMLPTCNTFNHVSVQARWNDVRSLLSTHFSNLGALISHASDGDRRRVKCMLQSIGRGTYGLASPAFIMKAEVINGLPILMDQDPFHIGKKLRNPILVATRNVFWGKHLATINHLRLVMTIFPRSKHGLLEEDVDVRDKQNVAAVQRAASLKVRACLDELYAGCKLADGTNIQEDVLGTRIHLEVIHSFLQVFYGGDSLYQRAVLASFVVHLVYMGSAFIQHRGLGHSLKENWLTREGQTDLLISCHFAINLIRLMRDNFSSLPVCLEKAGSDCVESVFSLMGQWVRNKHNFSFGEALERMSHISRLEQIKVDDASPLFAASRRRKLIWAEVNGTLGVSANLMDYSSVSDVLLEKAWAEGEGMARDRALTAGMLDVLQEADKWDCPWPASLSESEALAAELITDDDLEEPGGSAGSAPDSAPQISPPSTSDPSQSQAGPSVVERTSDQSVGSEPASEESVIRSSILEALQEAGEIDGGGASNALAQRTSSTVEVPGKGLVYKMRLITELNANPEHLSLDRLTRVQARAQLNVASTSSNSSSAEEMVGLFDDVALELINDQDEHTWYLARIQKMFKVTSTGARITYQRPVSIAEGERESGMKLIVKYYKAADKSRLVYRYGGYEDEGEADPMPLDAVLCCIKLSPVNEQGLHELEQTDRKVLDAYIKREVQQTQARTGAERPLLVRSRVVQKSVAVAGEARQTTEHVTRGGRTATRVVLK
jgi:hypothetical protein